MTVTVPTGRVVSIVTSRCDQQVWGGNALPERGEHSSAEVQQQHVTPAAQESLPLVPDHDRVSTHRDRPQVGRLALTKDSDPLLTPRGCWSGRVDQRWEGGS